MPQIDHQELIDNIEGHHPSRTYGCFDPSVNEVSNSCEQPCSYDLGQDIGITRKQLDDSCFPLNEMSDDAFRTLAQNLNLKQKEFFYHVYMYHWLKTETNPLYIFLSGGAGVGKSVGLRALYQALLKYYTHRPGEKTLTISKFYVVLQQEKLLITLDETQYTTHLAFQLVGDLNFNL